MLSFDFLTDDVVMSLTHVGTLLLAGMISRSDNLGRLPGEPDVLLAFLYYPKRPRPDVSTGDVEQLLNALASSKRITWYVVGGVRYVQFNAWAKNQPGIREHNRKSSFPAPSGEHATLMGETLPLELQASVARQRDDRQVDVAQLVRAVSAQAREQKSKGELDYDAIKQWMTADGKGMDQSKSLRGADWLKFSAWLWNTGSSTEDVLAVLDECYRLNPREPYAYFAPSRQVRQAIQMRKHGDAAAEENARIKALERKALSAKD